jgi:membrane-bound lytic murein transglycosylase MltF
MNFQQKTEIASLRSQGKKNVVSNDTTNTQSGYFTDERIKDDLDYRRAQEIAQKMLNDGLISVDEFNKLTGINRETFSPLFAEIMPKSP